MNESIAKLPERTLSPNSGLLELYERESSFQGFGILQRDGTFLDQYLPELLGLIWVGHLTADLHRRKEMAADTGEGFNCHFRRLLQA